MDIAALSIGLHQAQLQQARYSRLGYGFVC